MKTSVKTKIFCILLLLAMVLQMCPVFALADEVTDPETGEGDILDGGELGTEDGEGTEDGALDDGEEEIDYSNAVPVTSADELEIALSEGRTAIRIDADFLLDRTFYVEKSTVIVADAARVLKRAPTFGGDIFVVGEVRDGTMTTEPVVLTVGKPDDATPSMIVIDGNAENMTVDVVGTVFFVREASRVDLYDNLTAKNHTKTGNEKTLDEDYASKLSYHIRVGGAVAIVAGKASMRIYGGLYQNNRVNDITDADTDEGNLSSQGGVIYNYGTLDVYGGRFENNYAARAGVFYNYRTLNLYNAELVGNTASSLGGAIYVPASTAAYLYIGEENGVSESRVLFENNVSKGSGGAIYAQHVATVKNAVFRNNVTLTGEGGAICAGKIEMQMDATVFDSNAASEGYGGALYITGSNGEEDEKELNAGSTQFLSNTSARGGAIYMNDGVRAYFSNLTMQENSSSGYAGAIYATGEGTLLEINGASSVGNTSVSHGGMLYLSGSAKALLNNLTVKENTGKQGGAIYAISAELTVYNSLFEKCSSSALGGAIDAHDGAVLNAYNTRFVGNTAGTNGGAIILYTAGTQSLIHSCVFEGNTGDYGGALYLSNKSLVDIYNITATNNSALKGGFMYETTTGTVVKLVGTTVSGNTASEGGPIIWGNSTGAKLHIDKLKYVDNDYEGDWNDAYWASAIYNSLKVYEITGTIPSYEQYGTGETVEPPAAQSAINVKSASELERALEVGYTIIRITADFALDRTFFVKENTTIYATEARRLTRAADFGGDIFVVGMTASGKRVKNAVLTLGKTDGTDASLIIDGNAAAMTVDVVGTVVLVCDDAVADLGTKLTVQNCTKVGNDRLLSGFEVSSYPGQVGGAVAVIEQGGEMNIYGGSYSNNSATDITVGPDAGKISYGGAFFNHGRLNVYGGSFTENHAGRGGAFYNYRKMYIYSGEIKGNTASTYGGAIYIPNTTSAYLYICDDAEVTTPSVYFTANSAKDGGGAIYARNLLYIANTVFEDNTVTGSHGGAIYAGATRLTLLNCVFRGNTAKKYGGAIYLASSNGKAETPELIAKDCLFEKNSAVTRAGVAYVCSEARAYFADAVITENTSASGGAFYVYGASLEMNGADITGNTATGSGAVFYIIGEVPSTVTEDDPIIPAYLLANRITVKHNQAATNGCIYSNTATTEIYNSEFSENTAKIGGVAYVSTDAVWKSYNTLFKKNTATTDGGALHIYPGTTESVIHSCVFEENDAGSMGGAIKVNGEAHLSIYNTTATKNNAAQGGFMYETKMGTVVTIVGLTVSGNTATDGGAIIWGNTLNAKLYIDKTQYTDQDATGALDAAYWKAAIYNKLTVYEINGTIPKYLDYGNEAYDQMPDAVDVTNADELEAAILAGHKHIRIVADILVDRTFYITGDVTVFTTIGRTLKRAPTFGGDIFVVGENADGKSSLLMGNNASLTLGNPYSVTENLLVFDGNASEMQVPVVGSVVFVCNSAKVALYDNVTVMNCHKTGNERSENEKYRLAIANRVGGTLAVVASGTLDIYGGNYKNNTVNEETGSTEAGLISSVGGLIFNYSNLNIYGGTFEGNQAAKGAVIYNYRIAKILGGRFEGNLATVSGGVYYAPNSAQVHLYVGSADASGETVVFANNAAKMSGGAIYASTRSANVIYGNTSFIGNTAQNGSGGAIYIYGQLTVRDTLFENNTASSRGGAIYASNSTSEETSRLIEVTRCTFEGNDATLGGAISLYASSSDQPEGALVTVTDSTFTANRAAIDVANASSAYGGAVYLERKSYFKADGCTFKSNEASTEAGAIYIAGESRVLIKNSVITKSKSGKYGGAIAVRSSYLTLDNTDITESYAVSNGGAIYVSYQSAREINTQLIIQDSLIANNATDARGGAIYATRRDLEDAWDILTVKNTVFEANSAANGGGALYTVKDLGGYFENVSFLKNTVSAEDAQGGAIYAYGSKLELNGASFVENTALSNGGAISTDAGATLVLNEVTASGNTGALGGFAYLLEGTMAIYDSTFTANAAAKNGGAIYATTDSVLKVYNTAFSQNTAALNGGALMIYTAGTQSILHGCTFTGNAAETAGGALYISNKSLVDIYNVTAKNNTAPKGGFMYETTSGTVVKLVGLTVSGNTASEGGAIIWGNTNNAKLFIDKAEYTDLDATGVLDDAYWKTAIYNLLTVEAFDGTVPAYEKYEREEPAVEAPKPKPAPTTVDQIFALAQGTGSEYISSKYDAFPVLDNSSNFMSDGVTYFENINGETVTVDSFIYGTKATDGNCTVGEGLLIYQAMLYKQAHPDEDVSIHISAYRVSVEAAVNINRNNRYFGYMRNLVGREYDNNGFVRVSYLLVTAARMGINVTVIGQIDGYPVAATDPNLHEYFNEYLATECDPKYAQGTVGDYMNFAECFWTLDNGKGGTDMMHTKLCAVSHYLDMNGVAHKNAVFTTSSNLDGISSNGTNGNWKLQTGTIVSDHAYLYRISVNYLDLIAAYCEQEKVYEFQDLMSRVGAEQIALILDGKMSEIPEDELLVYLGTENDDVFEMYFTPFGGSTAVWDEDNNPYCKYLREMYNSEDSIIFVWNAAEYSSTFPLGDQMEEIIAGAFHSNANVENKFFGNMEGFNAARLEGLVVGENIGYLSLNQYPFGSVHNKDILLSYVKDGQRYYVSLLNSCNMHSGSMSYQSNFMLVIKETECAEDSVFFTMADLATTGIVEHTYGEETSYLPDDGSHGYYYRPCLYCDKKLVLSTIHRPGEWITDREGSTTQNEILHRECRVCALIVDVKEIHFPEKEETKFFTRVDGMMFDNDVFVKTNVVTTPSTFEVMLQLDAQDSERGGVLVGNYDFTRENVINLEVFSYGRIRLYTRNAGAISECYFSTSILSSNPVHVAVTVDGVVATLYINGVLAETTMLSSPLPKISQNLMIGGDVRYDNPQYFKGTIYSVALFDDVRTAAEIKKDMMVVADDVQGLLYARSFATAKPDDCISGTLGQSFTSNTPISLKKLKETPATLEAIVQLPLDFVGRGGVVVGNYHNSAAASQINLEIYENGVPRLYLSKNGLSQTYLFDADVRSSAPVHIAVTVSDKVAILYVNGEMVDIKELSFAVSAAVDDFKVGGDNRADNSQYFKGIIHAVGLYGEVRTADQIKRDAILMESSTDDLLYLCYYRSSGASPESGRVEGTIFTPGNKETVESLSSAPHTFEATVLLPKAEYRRAGVIFGNYDNGTSAQVNFEIWSMGLVRLFYYDGVTRGECIFHTDVRSDVPIHIALTADGNNLSLYLNGELSETRTIPINLPAVKENYVVGGDNRVGNEQFFKGELYSLYIFSDVRTAEEIKADYLSAPTNADDLIYAKNFAEISCEKPAAGVRPAGKIFDKKDQYTIDSIQTTPKTFEALVWVPVEFEGRAGTIVGNYNGGWDPQVNIEIYEGGKVRLFYVNGDFRVSHVFEKDIRSDAPVHIALTVEGTNAVLYVNGNLAETAILPLPMPENTSQYLLGRDHRYLNSQYFKGTLYSVAVFSDVRTAEEIEKDAVWVNPDADSLLFTQSYIMAICDPYSSGLTHVEGGWIVDREATQSTDGLMHRECIVCNTTLALKEISRLRLETSYSYSLENGLSFKQESDALALEKLSGSPKTFEFLVHLDPILTLRAGVLFGSYDGGNGNGLNVEIYTNGQVRLYYKVGGIGYSYVFAPDIRSEGMTHIALTVDGLTATLYVNGQMKQALTLDVAAPEITEGFFVGNDRRPTSGQYFKGNIYSVAVFDDVRTAEEIALDAIVVTSDAEGVLYHEIFAAQN